MASAAVGRRDVGVQIEGQSFGRSSGMAPGARLAVYKACWTAPDPADDGCATADAVAAVDRAVADGVDVIGFAVAGSDDPHDSLSRAFLGASAAGVFVAAAAGNEGPEAGTVRNAAPWVTTVAAGTSHVYEGSVRLPDGSAYDGAMTADAAVPATRAVLAADAAAAARPALRGRTLRERHARRGRRAGRRRGLPAGSHRPRRQVHDRGPRRRGRHGAGQHRPGQRGRGRARRAHGPPPVRRRRGP